MRIEIKSDTPIKDICKQHGCSRATASRARKRGYLVKDYHTGGEHAKKKEQSEFLRVLGLEEINKNSFSCKEWKIQKIQQGVSNLYAAEFITFKTEVTRLRNFLRVYINAPTNTNLEKICESKYIVKKKICRWETFRKTKNFQDAELQQVKITVSALYNALLIV